MPSYYRRVEFGQPEKLTLEEFVNSIKSEMMWSKEYYEYMFMQFGHGHKLIGSRHIYWMEWD